MNNGLAIDHHSFAGITYQPGARVQLEAGIDFQTFHIPERSVQARSLVVDPTQVNLRVAISPELIDRSFARQASAVDAPEKPPPEHNSGLSLPVFMEKLRPTTARQHLLAACNCLHTNFVRGNGFVFRQGRLICKSPGAVALDASTYQALNGVYTALKLCPLPGEIVKIRLRNNRAIADSPPWLAISGPQIVRDGQNIAGHATVRLPQHGPTGGDEINFDPQAVRTSFTALGLTPQGELLILSLFAGAPATHSDAGLRLFHPQPGTGLTLVELADWLVDLGTHQAILGGGSGDTQQYIRGGGTWVSLPRQQPGRTQVAGVGALGAVRGLGAILLINS